MLQIRLKIFFSDDKFKVKPHIIEIDKDFFKKMTKFECLVTGNRQQMSFYSLNKKVRFWEVHFFTT